MQPILSAADRFLAAIENALIVAIVTTMVLMAFLQVVLRNLDAGLLWGDIFLRHLVLWVGFIGASLATRDEKHIRIDALSRITSARLIPYIAMVIDAATILVCYVLMQAGAQFVTYEYEAESILFNDVPAWIFQLIIPVGFGLIGFRFFLKLLERIMRVIRGTPPEPESPSAA